MNCWRNVADKFDMSPEDAEKKVKDICLFFSVITAIKWKPVDCWDRWDCQDRWTDFSAILGIPAIIGKPDLKNSGENEGRLAHQTLLVQLSSEKNPASSSIPAINFSVILKEIERTYTDLWLLLVE